MGKICLAIFSPNKDEILKKYIQPNNTVVIKNKKSVCKLEGCEVIDFEWVSRNYSMTLELIKDKLLILYDIDRMYKYDTTLARFFCNIASKETQMKIVCGNEMVKNHNYEIFSYYFFLDKQILNINHYWCFKANHFILDNGKPIKMLDKKYIAPKVAPYTIFEFEPRNELEKEVLNEIISAK